MLRQMIERVADVRGMCGEEGHEAADQADALDDELALRHLRCHGTQCNAQGWRHPEASCPAPHQVRTICRSPVL